TLRERSTGSMSSTSTEPRGTPCLDPRLIAQVRVVLAEPWILYKEEAEYRQVAYHSSMAKHKSSHSDRRAQDAGAAQRLKAELLSNDDRPIVDKVNLFERLAEIASRWISSTWGLVFATSIFVVWLAAGPICGWERSWYYVDAV